MERRKALEDEIVDKEREMAVLTQRWNAEKSVLEGVKGAKEKLETARHDLQTAEVCAYSAYSLASVQHTPPRLHQTHTHSDSTHETACVYHGCVICDARIASHPIIPAVVVP